MEGSPPERGLVLEVDISPPLDELIRHFVRACKAHASEVFHEQSLMLGVLTIEEAYLASCAHETYAIVAPHLVSEVQRV